MMPAAIAALSLHVNSDSQGPRHKMHYFAGSGTLVAQDLSKEPAPVLLRRIKAQRESRFRAFQLGEAMRQAHLGAVEVK
jgi:hypothetical protein